MPGGGEAPRRNAQEVEASMATDGAESPAWGERLMEAICDPENIDAAARAVRRNKGAPGVDGMTVKQLPDALERRWSEIARALVEDAYRPQPVKRVQIPKPDGSMRNLGIPTVIDRVIQQAILQRLQPVWDPTFSASSYGFRRSPVACDGVLADALRTLGAASRGGGASLCRGGPTACRGHRPGEVL